MIIKQAGSPDNKQTINLAVNLAHSILHAHNCNCNIISPVLNCLISCLSSYVNLLLAQRRSSVYSEALGLQFLSRLPLFKLEKHEQRRQPWLSACTWTPRSKRCEKVKEFHLSNAEKHQETVEVMTEIHFSDLTSKTS